MRQPHPSLLLVLDIDESLATDETRAEVSRTYGYVGSTVMRPHETPEDGSISNTIVMRVKLPGVAYMREDTEQADAFWDEMMQRWLFNQFHTVGNHMQIYNRRQREEGKQELYFDWLRVELENGAVTVNVKLDSVSSLPPECSEVFGAIRRALCDGSIGADVDTVYIPSPDSYQAQAREWANAAPEREAMQREAEQAAEQAQKEEEAREEASAEENFGEAPDLAEPDPEELDEEYWQAELERKYSLPAHDFDIDYAIWGLLQPDGSIADFDSTGYLRAGGES